MVWIEGGTFRMGSDRHDREPRHAHEVRVNGFWIDRACVTNEQFERFARETGYVTLAERPVVAAGGRGAESEHEHAPWADVPGASWRHPRGPGSSIDQLRSHPVVHVAFGDAVAYASWAGRRLPTEAEWEFAARGGLNSAKQEWSSPAGALPANGYGLLDMAGNVWQWTVDGYAEQGSDDPCPPQLRIPRKAIKGGSLLAAPDGCRRYHPGARRGRPVDTSSCHVGFRCVIRYDGLLP
jgi:formylglycine-generating enzyme required for sulfatase activity